MNASERGSTDAVSKGFDPLRYVADRPAPGPVQRITSSVWLHLHPPRIGRRAIDARFSWCAGGIAFLLFLLLTITGVILMFFYRPTPEQAYADIMRLQHEVPFGWLLRNIHRWSAHGMVLVVWIHMLRVFLTGSYKPPRQMNWIVGVALLILTLLLSFTGYLLPWDQLAYWAVTVGTRMAAAAPFIGHEGPGAGLLGVNADNDLRAYLLGGSGLGGQALLRFYVLHCLALPLVMMALTILHIWRVRKDGFSAGL